MDSNIRVIIWAGMMEVVAAAAEALLPVLMIEWGAGKLKCLMKMMKMDLRVWEEICCEGAGVLVLRVWLLVVVMGVRLLWYEVNEGIEKDGILDFEVVVWLGPWEAAAVLPVEVVVIVVVVVGVVVGEEGAVVLVDAPLWRRLGLPVKRAYGGEIQ